MINIEALKLMNDLKQLINTSEYVGKKFEDLAADHGIPNKDRDAFLRDKGARGKLLDFIVTGSWNDTRPEADLKRFDQRYLVEQKVVPTFFSKRKGKHYSANQFVPKDTIKITSAKSTPFVDFESSVLREKTEYGLYHFWGFKGTKLKRLQSPFLGVLPHALDKEAMQRIESEHDEIQSYINKCVREYGFIKKGTTSVNRYVQIRTSGNGKGAKKTYSWYFTKIFILENLIPRIDSEQFKDAFGIL